MIGQYFFLGATLRDITSQSVRHHNKQSFIKRIHDVKTVSVTIYEDFYKFWFNFVTRYVGLIISLNLFLLISSCAQIWPLQSSSREIIRVLFRLIC